MSIVKYVGIIGAAAAALMIQPAMAQNSKVTSAWNYMNYQEWDKARDAINEAVKHEKTMNEPKTWLYRGQVYAGIYQSPKFKDSEPNALMESFNSFKKGIELDVKGKNSQLRTELLNISRDLFNEATTAYRAGSHKKALEFFNALAEAKTLMGAENAASFDKMLEANKIKPSDVTTLAADAAMASGDTVQAISIFQKLVDAKYDKPFAYISLSEIYKNRANYASAIDVLDKGMATIEDKKDLLISKLNIYIQQGKEKEALEIGKKAMELDPENISLYIAMGNIYDNLKMPKEAQEMYNAGIAKDPESFSTNYSVGISFFNMGADLYNKSLEAKAMAEQTKLENAALDNFRKAVPYLEKAATKEVPAGQESNMRQTLEVLAEMHAKLSNNSKSQEYREKLKNYKK